jgi:hypothetical protein
MYTLHKYAIPAVLNQALFDTKEALETMTSSNMHS